MISIKDTNIESIRQTAKSLLRVEPQHSGIESFVYHPFFMSNPMFLKDEDGERFVDIFDKESFDKVVKMYDKALERAKDVWTLYILINRPYRTLFFKLIRNDLSEKDYNEMLSDCWTSTENPNQDANVMVRQWYSYFRKANKEILMEKEEYNIYKTLPEKIKVYRGVGKGRNPKGLSWTTDREVAEWFAKRWGNDKAYMFEGYCNKENVLAYFNRRSEKELIIGFKDIIDLKKVVL